MNHQTLKINILPFEHEKKPATFSFFKVQHPGFISLSLHEAPIGLKDQLNGDSHQIENLYTDFVTTLDADFQIEVNLSKSTKFAKHYYTHLIRQYLKDKVDLVSPNFIKDVDAWIHEPDLSTDFYKAYRVYGLRVQIARITESPELLIYYQGISKVLNKSIIDLDEISEDIYTKAIFKNEIMYYDNLSNEAKYNKQEVYPIVNKDLELKFDLSDSTSPFRNIYQEILTLLSNFVTVYLSTDEFKELINLSSTDFLQADDNLIFHTRSESNYIQLGLGDKVKVFTPKENLKTYGPYKLPEKTNVKFLIIYHENDSDYANKLVHIMRNRYQLPNGKFIDNKFGTSLYEFIRIKFNLDKEHSIPFNDEMNPHTAIHEFIDNNDFDTENFQYLAYYISPFNKDESDDEKKKIYYKVKETLLKHHITSQVIFREHILDKKFKSLYYVNIAAATLAKVGGIPWRLDSEVKNELIIGVGAFKHEDIGTQYIGSAFCFSNNGEFQEFSCTSKSNPRLLAAKIKVYIKEYVDKNKNIERLVIHFYKEMSKKEIAPIKQILFDLGYPNLPIFIININKTFSGDYLAFDTSSVGLIPYSGTILQIGRNQYLLFNNTRYTNAETESIESYHRPIKLNFQCTKRELLYDKKIIKDMIDQIYQFSRMYWKSVKQQKLPVTVKYPELVAQMYPYFESEEILDFEKTNMWFL